jgi:hypothetical protein
MVEPSGQLAAVEGNAIGQIRVVFAPDVFRRVEFGSIRRKPFEMNAMTSSEKIPHFPALVDGSAIPEEEDGAAKVSEQMSQKRADVQAREIMGAHTDIESQPLPLGGKDQCVKDRNPVLLVQVADLWSLSTKCPGPFDMRDEQEPTFVEKDQVSSQCVGVFLYAASGNASTVRWPSRPFAALVAPVSGSLIPNWSKASTHDTGDTPPRNICESNVSHGLTSRDPWRNPGPEHPPAEAPGVSPSEEGTACAGVPVPAGHAIPSVPSVDSSATSETLNWRPLLWCERSPTTVCRPLKAGWRAGAASPGAPDFHWVSCMIV